MVRPRERLLVEGAGGLASDELLAVVLGTGMPGEAALVVARRILAATGGLGALSRARGRELLAIPGLGPARAARLVAAFSLGRRALEDWPEGRPVLASAADVDRLMRPRLGGLGFETFWVVALSVKNEVLDLEEIGRGSLTSVDVHPREVFRFLALGRAARGVLVHNHPSGDPTPSGEDIELTRRMILAGQLFGIPIVDHVVVAAKGFRSVVELDLAGA